MLFKMFKPRNEVSKLIEERDKLSFERQHIHDAKNLANSKIEHKIKALENQAWRNQIKASNAIEEINRKLERVERNLISEKEYVNSVSTYGPEEIRAGVKNSFISEIPNNIANNRDESKCETKLESFNMHKDVKKV